MAAQIPHSLCFQDELHDELEDHKLLFSEAELTEKEKADLR